MSVQSHLLKNNLPTLLCSKLEDVKLLLTFKSQQVVTVVYRKLNSYRFLDEAFPLLQNVVNDVVNKPNRDKTVRIYILEIVYELDYLQNKTENASTFTGQ